MTNGQHNRPGYSARQIAKRRYLRRILIALSAAMLLILSITLIPHEYKGLGSWGILLGILFFALLTDRFVDSVVDKSRKWERKALRGAKAEEHIGVLLEQLTGPCAVFNDVNKSYGDIDHILLSPEHGIILIETKSHHGTIAVQNGTLMINDQTPEKDFIAQTLGNVFWLRKRLKETTGLDVWINPIIVFTNAFVPLLPPIRGIRLRNKKYLLQAIGETRTDAAVSSKLWALHEQGKSLW